MTKNKMMRIASVLLVAVLLSTCAISGTFAKYVTSDTGSDNARVAKWGFKTTSLVIDMFDGSYTNVQSGTAENVVAPGTTKTATIELVPAAQAAPEVAYTFDLNVTAVDTTAALLNELVWSLNGTKVGDFAALQAAVNTEYDKSYNAGVLPTDEIEITWEWEFENGDNVTDTTLGNEGTAVLTIKLDFTATQVD